LKNASDVEDNAYKTPLLAYNRELNLLVSTNSITRSDMEKENPPPYPEYVMINLEKETTNLEDTTPMVTPQSTTCSNKLNDPPMAPNLTQYVQNRV
jgi:hypothetical protein